MSAPAVLACSAVAVCLGLSVIAAATHVEARHSAAGAADAAALAAADAMTGWIDLEPCTVANQVVLEMGASLVECNVDPDRAVSHIVAQAGEGFQSARARARAEAQSLPSFGEHGSVGSVGANGWAWPSDSRGVTQSFHDGYAIDLAVTAEGALFAPFDGVIVAAGPDGGSVPAVCQTRLWWWHGPNITVVMRHEVSGGFIYSSHNHVDPGSLSALGIAPGVRVSAGQQVASAGMSGCTSGLHTHFTLSSYPTNAYPDLDPFVYIGFP
ncbi:M23 family metallopeptidase [Leucobacter insecticola]|uniref:M23 family metallopeptidase n=1 Tax=Leucobacter insecticola TaxID=2714934 RepID=A0A6G8FFY9_9MICO|nr:M23 family metallopeptidase [Leucobacter insecticola]QIM15264.1 M23 family metallopeptidase [Leucobacter insecticola]